MACDDKSICGQGLNRLGSTIERFDSYDNVPNLCEYSGRSVFVGIRSRL